MPISNPSSGSTIITGSVSIEDRFNTNDIEEASSTITYIGMEDKDGAWYIKKIDTTTLNEFKHATVLNNSGYTTYTNAWTNRAILIYSDFSGAF